MTSQPDVACEICGRRLLRGERPEVFLAGGQRRTVCELCAPRAAYEGWLRESDDHPVDSARLPGKRGRTLLDRLRQLREPVSGAHARPVRAGQAGSSSQAEPYGFLAGGTLAAPKSPAFFEESFDDHHYEQPDEQPLAVEADSAAQPTPSNTDLKAARAVEVFNVSEQPRRLSGVARSLGPAAITVRALEESSSRVWIVVAWDLCWYRYEVDLAEEAAGVVLREQGMELDELPPEDRAQNAAADERGEIQLL
ncbi:MAG TPA: hypothetical protein VIC05_05580 [Solirubrobacteraceae bacterium]